MRHEVLRRRPGTVSDAESVRGPGAAANRSACAPRCAASGTRVVIYRAAMATLSDNGFLDLGDQRLEYRMVGPRPHEAPTLVLLHQGLGSVGQWDDLPEKLAVGTGCG